MITRQRVGGAMVAVLGALGVTSSVYLDWWEGREARHIPLERLFQVDVADQASSYWNSLAVPLAVVGVLGVLGALLLTRSVLALGWLIGVAALLLWLLMQANDDTVDLAADQIQRGFWLCAASLLVMLGGIGAMRASTNDS